MVNSNTVNSNTVNLGTVNSNTVNLNIVNLNMVNSNLVNSCLNCTVYSNFHLFQRKTLLTNDFELTVPDLYWQTDQ